MMKWHLSDVLGICKEPILLRIMDPLIGDRASFNVFRIDGDGKEEQVADKFVRPSTRITSAPVSVDSKEPCSD